MNKKRNGVNIEKTNKMKILSLNLNRNENWKCIMEESQANICSFQESKLLLYGRTWFNTINIINGEIEKNKLLKFEELWKSYFPWQEFPENYFAENEIIFENKKFMLINVHIAGFGSGLRQLLMFVLLERLKLFDLKSNNVILLGDFNAKSINGTGTKKGRIGSLYLDEIVNLGFEEIINDEEKKTGAFVDTYRDKENIGHRYDHVYIRYKDKDPLFKIDVKYFPEGNKKWFSDHRGIIVNIYFKDKKEGK